MAIVLGFCGIGAAVCCLGMVLAARDASRIRSINRTLLARVAALGGTGQ